MGVLLKDCRMIQVVQTLSILAHFRLGSYICVFWVYGLCFVGECLGILSVKKSRPVTASVISELVKTTREFLCIARTNQDYENFRTITDHFNACEPHLLSNSRVVSAKKQRSLRMSPKV